MKADVITALNLAMLITITVLFTFTRIMNSRRNRNTTEEEEEGDETQETKHIPKLDKETIESLIVIQKVSLASSSLSTSTTTNTTVGSPELDESNEPPELSLSLSLSSEKEDDDEKEKVTTLPSTLFILDSNSSVDIEQGQINNVDFDNIIEEGMTSALQDGKTTCEICLGNYEVGDLIGSSHNNDCIHHFHKDCIVNWLHISSGGKRHSKRKQNNMTCPVCRRDFVSMDDVTNLKKKRAIEDDNHDAVIEIVQV